MLDLETLRLIWWAILGILLIGFAILDGFDLGVAGLLPFLGRTDEERKTIISAVEPVWEGNQVWLILGAGASFAAWPFVYAVSFSGFYFAMFLALFTLILRPVGFKFRNKMPGTFWRSTWDLCLCISGIVPAFVFGVAFGNLFEGVPFHFDDTLRIFYTGSFWGLFSTFSLLCGLLSVFMMMYQGSLYLCLKMPAPLARRSLKSVLFFGTLVGILFALGGLLLKTMEGYQIVSPALTTGPSHPLHKEVVRVAGGWLNNYKIYSSTYFVPLLTYISLVLSMILVLSKKTGVAFIFSSLTVFGLIATAGLSLFPFLVPSSSHPSMSLTIWDSSSSQKTLFVMLMAVVIFLPIILAYTAWVYRVLKGKVKEQSNQGY
jgi:cytochrome d ubiquinol oxidase subunit II